MCLDSLLKRLHLQDWCPEMSRGTLFLGACPLCLLQTLDLLGKNVELIEILELLECENIKSHHLNKTEQDSRKSARTSKLITVPFKLKEKVHSGAKESTLLNPCLQNKPILPLCRTSTASCLMSGTSFWFLDLNHCWSRQDLTRTSPQIAAAFYNQMITCWWQISLSTIVTLQASPKCLHICQAERSMLPTDILPVCFHALVTYLAYRHWHWGHQCQDSFLVARRIQHCLG